MQNSTVSAYSAFNITFGPVGLHSWPVWSIMLSMNLAYETAQVMGGQKVIRKSITTVNDLRKVVEAGLPKRALEETVEHLHPGGAKSSALLHRIVPKSTLARRKKLLPDESARTERLARIIALAEYVWNGNVDAAKRFLLNSHPELDGEKPIELAISEIGARQVEELLWKIVYGLPV